jgi:Tol biopolymer transport system component
VAKKIRKRQRESLLKSANLVILLPLLSSLFLFLNCKTEFVDPIPSFCATEADWGPNDVILFTNDPSKIVPPETGYQLDSAGLWAVNADGGEVRFLDAVTPDGVEVRGAPEWSPDGLWFVTSDLMGRVWLVSASADSFVKLTESGGIWRPALRPDGRKIAFSTSDSDALGPRGLRTLDLETGVKSFVFPYGMDPSWSPDGSRLVFFGWLPEGNGWTPGIIVVDTTGTNARLVCRTDGVPAGRSVSFSPDGDELAFHMQDGGRVNQVWVVKTDGSNLRQRTWKGGQWPSWSYDGTEIIYTRVSYRDRIQVGSGDLYVIPARGSGERRLTFFYPKQEVVMLRIVSTAGSLPREPTSSCSNRHRAAAVRG